MLALGEGANRSIRDCDAEAMDHGESPSMNMLSTERSCLRLFQCSGILAFQNSLLELPELKKALTGRFLYP